MQVHSLLGLPPTPVPPVLSGRGGPDAASGFEPATRTPPTDGTRLEPDEIARWLDDGGRALDSD